jgi:hypothetical protein
MITRTALRDVRRLARVVMLAGALAPAIGWAQTQTAGQTPTETEQRIEGPSYGKVTLLLTQAFDSNVFAVPESQHPISDMVTRFGPTFEVGRNSRRLNLSARYGMAAERYLDRYDLNTGMARQDGRIEMRYNASRRTELHGDGGYLDTQSPRELNLATLLTTGRTRAERISGNFGVAQSLTSRTKFDADYDVVKDTLAEHLSNLSNTGRFGVSWQTSPRGTVRVDYRPRYVEFGTVIPVPTATPPPPGAPVPTVLANRSEITQVISGGFKWTATPLTTIDVNAGPRFSSNDIRPEISATFRHRAQRGTELSASYLATQDTSFGEVLFGETPVLEAGFYDVQRVNAVLSITPLRPLTMAAMPAFARSTRLGRHSDVRELSVDITVRAMRKLTFIAAGRVSDQQSAFTNANDPIRGRLLALTAQLTLP